MSRLTKYMDNSFYPGFSGNWDNDLFRQILLERIRPDSHCLDLGAGRGNVEQMNFLGIAKFVAGIDPEEEVFANPYLDEAKQMDLKTGVIPYDDSTFDIVFSNNVMEHVQHPRIVFDEVRRVLKPGGLFLSKTPNRRHYVPTLARLTPTRFHKYYNKLRGRDSSDTFPTVYKLNSKGAVNKLSRETGFLVKRIQFVEGRPEYLRLTALTYLFGLTYERLVNSIDALIPFRCVMISELEKISRLPS